VGLLGGCSESTADYSNVEELVQEETRLQLTAEETELKQELQKLQATDPSVKDIYYTVDENGNKVLNVVRETADGSPTSDLYPMLAGAAVGALVSSMISSGSASNYARHNPPAYTRRYGSYQEERRERNSGSAAYSAALMNQQRGRVLSPSYKPSPSISTRATVNFSGGARSSAVGFGG
jgi:hypothetical protein